MTASKAAPRKTGAAARSEVNGRVKTVTIRKKTITLQSTVPLRILKQMGEIAALGDEARLPDMVAALELVLSDDQMEKIWSIEVKPTKDTATELQNLFGEAVDKVFTAYGITPGE